jgi:hypothetical protein
MSGTVPPTPAETPEQALARAQAATQARRFGEAAGICNDVLAVSPDNPQALALLGAIAAHTQDLDRGIALLEAAVAARPDVATWHANLGALYRMVYRVQNADHLVNLSLAFADADNREHAVVCLLRAIGLQPEHADAHLALGQNLLALGEFAPGWLEYEWRNRTEAGKTALPAMTSAAWNGMRIPSGRLLMVGDQGYGDTIQFARYIPMLAERCEQLILGCSAEMAPLLAAMPGVAQYCHRWTDVPAHAAHCRLSSVPGLLHTSLETIPASIPYLFADPARVAVWRERLDARLPADTRRIGLAWIGRPTHPNDRRRSCRWLASRLSGRSEVQASCRCRSRCRSPTRLRCRCSRGLPTSRTNSPISARPPRSLPISTWSSRRIPRWAISPGRSASRSGSCCPRPPTGAGCSGGATAPGTRPRACSAKKSPARGIR